MTTVDQLQAHLNTLVQILCGYEHKLLAPAVQRRHDLVGASQ